MPTPNGGGNSSGPRKRDGERPRSRAVVAGVTESEVEVEAEAETPPREAPPRQTPPRQREATAREREDTESERARVLTIDATPADDSIDDTPVVIETTPSGDEVPQLGLPTEPRPPKGMGRIRSTIYEFKPSVVTGGASFAPLGLIAMLNIVDGMGTNAFNVLLPEIRDYFGISLSFLTIIGTLIGVMGIFVAVPVGFLSDRINRVWLTVFGAALIGFMTMGFAFSVTFIMLATFRFGASLGQVLTPNQQAMLSDYYPPSVRGAVFSFNQMANRVGNFGGPLIAGALGTLFVWQVPFLVIGVLPLAVAVVIALRLKDAVRGEQERRLMGASEEAAKTGEVPPSWTESWRIAKSVRTLRRFWYALPFVSGSIITVATIMPLFYEEVFGLGPSARGAISAFDEPFTIAGLAVGAIATNKFLRYRPGRVITYLGMMSAVTALSFAITALSPWLVVSVGFGYVRAFFSAILTPALGALTAMVIPPRARGFALGTVTFFIIPGYLFFLAFGQIGDALGLRAGLLVMSGVYLIGAFIIMSGGASVDADIRAAQAASIAHLISREAKDKGEAKMLVVKDLDVHYDQVQILFNVDFEVQEGEIIALLGTNGAGKSTLLRAISGTTHPSNGAIIFDGEDITHMPPSAHAGRGIIQVPGGKGVFPSLTVAENLKIAAWLYRSDSDYVSAATASVLERFPILQMRYNEQAGNLSGGEQQMLTLAQAFLSRPRLLMIDELSLGLAPTIVEQLLGIVKAIAEAGTTIILVEQSVNLALTIARRAVFMEKGEIKFTGSTEELMARPDILRSVYLKGAGGGAGPVTSYGARSRALVDGTEVDALALEVRGISKRFGGIAAIPHIDLTLEEGKILGLIGPNGAGKTTLFDIISGFLPSDSGQVFLFGEEVTGMGPDERAKLGLARSFQDARLFPSLTVTENLAVALERHLTSKSTIAAALHLPTVSKSEKGIERRIDRLIRLMNIGDFRDKFVRELSTGSRRIVDLACVMACDPKVLLLDEPSSGIAQREAEELAPLLQKIKWETGCSILIIEHDMPLLSSVSDELVALDLGTVVTRGKPQDVLDHPKVIESYLGTSEEVIQRSGQLS